MIVLQKKSESFTINTATPFLSFTDQEIICRCDYSSTILENPRIKTEKSANIFIYYSAMKKGDLKIEIKRLKFWLKSTSLFIF